MRNRLLFSLLITVILTTSGFSQPVRTFVSTSGSDSNPCGRTTPCRNFEAAIAAVTAGGEVVVLDTGGFGPAVITKSVALIAPRGLHAAIAPTVGSAIHINAAPTDAVILRNLYLKAQGAIKGVEIDSAASVALEQVTIEGFGSYGLENDAADVAITVTDSVFRGNSFGITLFASGGLSNVSIHRSVFVDHSWAVYAHANSRVTIRDSVFQQFSTALATALEGNPNRTEITAQGCTFSHFPSGATAAEANGGSSGIAIITLVDSTITNTFIGARAYQNGTIRLSRSVITRCETGLLNTGEAGATIETDGMSMVHGNTLNTSGAVTPIPLL